MEAAPAFSHMNLHQLICADQIVSFVCFGQEMALMTEERNLHKFTLPRF